MNVLHQLRLYLTRPHVRPWALSAPILVLLVCLPLLRPLRHPDPHSVADDELARLATVVALAEQRTLDIADAAFPPDSGTVARDGALYSTQPPTLSFLLAGPYWVMNKTGLTFDENPALVAYLLTLLGATIPVAAAAGLIYRMGRLFELRRPWRALLGAAVVFGSGLVSYAVVLNAHAPAAAMVLASAAAIIHVAIAKKPRITVGWLAIAGLAVALAAAIDPAAAVFVILFAAAIPAMRWRWSMKFAGLLLFALGAAPPILLHVQLTRPVLGEAIPLTFQRQAIAERDAARAAAASDALDATTDLDDIDALEDHARAATWWTRLGHDLARLLAAFFGDHGLFTHFPVLLMGLFGVAAVMHRHWPATTKILATATLVGGIAIIVFLCLYTLSGPGHMFGPQAFIVFLPLLLFWSGAWLRRPHHAVKWTLASILLLFSIAVTLIGATNPTPRDGYDRYTVAQALSHLIRPPAPPPSMLANR